MGPVGGGANAPRAPSLVTGLMSTKVLDVVKNRITNARAASIIEVLKELICHVLLVNQDPSDSQITDEDAGAGRREVYLNF